MRLFGWQLQVASVPHLEITLDETDFQFEQFLFQPGQGEEKIPTGPLQADTPTQPSVKVVAVYSCNNKEVR